MTHSVRDLSLDYLKGFACLLMTIAHFPVVDKMDTTAVAVHYFAEYATVVFFAVSGVNSMTQAKKYSLAYLLALNAALFVLGMPFSLTVHADLYSRYVLEILQIIALGSLAVALVTRYLGDKTWLFAATGLGVMALKIARDLWWPEWHGGGLLFVHEAYVPRAEVTAQDKKIFPGFPVFPWLAFFLWGVFVYRLSQRAQALLSALLIMLFALGMQMGVVGDFHEKWDMSPAYLLLSLLKLSLCLWLVRAVPSHWLERPRALLFFGKNSLAFLYLHGFGLMAAFLVVKSLGQFPAWMLAIVVTWGSLHLLEKWRGFAVFSKPWPWLVLGAMCLLLPVLVHLLPATYSLVILLNIGLGILISRHFTPLRDMLRKVF